MEPFDWYPKEDTELRRPLKPGNCRHGYGLDLQKRTGQTRCAYCGVSLVDDYYHWLLLCVDHVVPSGECRRLKIPPELAGGLVNMVLACSGCNGFDNRLTMSDEQPRSIWSLEDFVRLRDRFFVTRKASLAERRAVEMAAFDRKEWKKKV